MKIEKREYSELVLGDKCLIQNHNKQMGTLIFQCKIGQYVCWESDGKEIWDDITHLKEKKTKLIGIVK
tara:strand:- start:3204 stop:3407 length:204 start_codon:yes stop_codon:yes gene_type:complete